MRHPVDKYTHLGWGFLDWTGTVYHPGLDYNRGNSYDDMGDPVYAYRNGVVIETGYNNGFGNYVYIQHKDNYSKYAHLEKILVRNGDRVNTQTKIGTIGNTGNSTGPHLHFEINKTNLGALFYPVGKPIDWIVRNYENPLDYIRSKHLKVLILANKTNWSTWEQKKETIRDWYLKKTNGQLTLDIVVENITQQIEWEYVDKWKNTYITQDCIEHKLLSKASGYDICIYVQEMKQPWETIANFAWAYTNDRLGVEFIAMQSDEKMNLTNFPDHPGEAFEYMCIHEIAHTLIQMWNNYSRNKIVDKVHEFDYARPSILEKSFADIAFEDLIGWNIPGKIRMFRNSPYPYERGKIIARELPNTPMFKLVIEGYKLSGFTETIPKL